MFLKILKIPFSLKCCDSGNQVILVGCCRTTVCLLNLLLPSAFGGHHLKAFLRQIGRKIVPSSQLLSYWDLLSGLHQSHCLVCVCVWGGCQGRRVEQRCSAHLVGGVALTMVGVGVLRSAPLILLSVHSGNGLSKSLKTSCLHSKLKWKVACKTLRMGIKILTILRIFVHIYIYIYQYS